MNSLFNELPVLGIGASLSLSAQPDPVSLVRRAGGPAFVEYAGLADVDAVLDDIDRLRSVGVPVLFHPSYLNFCGSYPNSAAWLDATAEHTARVGSAWFAQDCAYCFLQEGHGYSTSVGYFIPPILNQASLALAVERVREVQARVPVTVAIEPPPVSFVVGSMPVFAFFGAIAEATDCALLLDMGHLVSYEMATGRPVSEGLQDLPCERVIEVHVAGGRLKQAGQGPIYVDAHECEILPQTWAMLEQMLPLLPNLKAVCYECEGVEEDRVLGTLQRIRKLVVEHSGSPRLLELIESRT
jgi:uncharacterized protein (UPF0276 family)